MDKPSSIFIEDLKCLRYAPKHRETMQAKALASEPFNVSIYLLGPGGAVPPHTHSTSWDLIVVLEGELLIETEEAPEPHVCATGAIHLTPPGMVHAVRNASLTAQARFLLVQGPTAEFDFLPARLPEHESP